MTANLRELLSLAALLSSLSAGLAQDAKPSTNYVLKVTPDRADALYKQGEPVTFKVELTLDKQPVADAEVLWTITKDGVPPVTSGKVKLANGAATLTAS